jgi:hypothetical protein
VGARAVADDEAAERAVRRDIVGVGDVGRAFQARDAGRVVRDLEGAVRQVVGAGHGGKEGQPEAGQEGRQGRLLSDKGQRYHSACLDVNVYRDAG